MDAVEAARLVDEIDALCTPRGLVQVMEVCGTHTVSFFRTGAKSLLPESLRLVSGPGCPVCVTSQGYLDTACDLAARPDVIVCTYGDMVRVPGSRGSLADVRGRGGRVVIVYSARDALRIATENPEMKVVFLAVGFETTTPPTAATVLEADRRGIPNFLILPGHKLVIPAIAALLSEGDVPIDGFLCPGHVSIIIGTQAYEPIARDYGKPCVVAGFEPAQMLRGVLWLARQVAAGEAKVENVYPVAVTVEGNTVAQECIGRVFTPADAVWRAMGAIPQSGLELRERFQRFDARRAFDVEFGPDGCPPGCRCGEVIQGKTTPAECPLFASTCTPIDPVGPCMVSSEGTCAAWYKYNR
ncbi:hydrogenase formation protein HypD [bacterium]|nr:hydrogenase formation protein HypD [bacterium]